MDFAFVVPLLFAGTVVAALIALAQAFAVRRHWRARHRFACAHRGAWFLVFVLLAFLLCGLGLALPHRAGHQQAGPAGHCRAAARQPYLDVAELGGNALEGRAAHGAFHGMVSMRRFSRAVLRS